MADYTYWNKWSTPIWVSQDPDYDRFSKGMVRECLEFSDGEDRTEVAGTIKGKLYESDFNLVILEIIFQRQHKERNIYKI